MIRILNRVAAVLSTMLLCLGLAWARDPYPFKTKPREDKKEEVLRIDFEGQLPAGAQLGPRAKVEPEKGTASSAGLVAKDKGLVLKVPLKGLGMGMSRYEVLVDFAGEGFNLFTVALIPYGRDAKPLAGKKTTVGSEWGFVPQMQTWERRIVDLEFEGIHAVELEITATRSGTVRLDNIVVQRHETPIVLGSIARTQLRRDIAGEGSNLLESGDMWVAEQKGRQSFFDAGAIEPNRRYLNSLWRERLHLGSTYKQPAGTLPHWVLGVAADQAALDRAATAQKKTLAQMYEYFLDDVSAHRFNTVLVNFTKELEQFDELAAARGIGCIVRDPEWSGLAAWWSKPSEPAPPDALKATIEKNLKRYAGLKSLIGYDMNPSLGTPQQPMLAKARAYLASVAPNVQLGGEWGDIYAAENIEEPYPAFGIQWGGLDHYAGKPWVEPSHLFHPNYWPRYLSEGWVRRIHNGLAVRAVPNLWAVPAGRTFSKRSIQFQHDRVVTATTNWIYDDQKKVWSGWNRYQFPPQLASSLVWSALQSGASGIIFYDWGPATIASDVKGSQILKDDQYAAGAYQPDLLRGSDMSESAGWKELGEVGKTLARYQVLLDESTAFGRTIATTDKGDVRAKCLTGRKDPFKVIVVVNTKIGDYTDDKVPLKIDAETGALQGWKGASLNGFKLTVEDERDLYDLATGEILSGSPPKGGRRTYELSLAAGEGRIYFLGSGTLYRRFLTQYKFEDLAGKATKVSEADKAKTDTKTKTKTKGR
jgi:hypothetical protein